MSVDRSPSAAPERRCLVAIVHNGPVVYREVAESLIGLGFGNRVEVAKAAHGFAEIAFHWERGFPRVDAMRDACADLAIREGFSHLLFLDADMIFPDDLLMQMLRHHSAGIVGGLYVLKAPPYSPVAFGDVTMKDGIEHFAYLTDYGSELQPVTLLGMGCTLIPTDVFQQIGLRPWFAYENDADGWPRVSEDVPFCRKARSAGVPVLFDPTIKCGHVTTQIIDERWHKRYQRSVEAAAVAPMALTAMEGAPV